MNESATKRILIVDDDPDLLNLMRMTLEMEAYSVATAHNATEAFDYAFSHTPDMVLLDVHLPGMDGFKICETLKEDERTAGVPVVLLTGREEPSKEEQERVHADEFITKPIDRGRLFALLERHLH